MASVSTYLNFKRETEEAFNFYNYFEELMKRIYSLNIRVFLEQNLLVNQPFFRSSTSRRSTSYEGGR